MKHRAGFVNIIGNPNVGKSTLMNALVGERLSVISPKAQTTRDRILGIVNGDDFQIVFSDTPGFVHPAYRLQEKMMKAVNTALSDADIILFVTDVFEDNTKDDTLIKKVRNSFSPWGNERAALIVAVNKSDLVAPAISELRVAMMQEFFPETEIIPISALKGSHVESVLASVMKHLPQSPPYFSKDQLTDRPQRYFIAEMIREKIFLYYRKEIPYSCAVEITSFKESERMISIEAHIFAERESQKIILIGKKGLSLKKVGTEARKDIEVFLEKKVFLSMRVKVRKGWRNNDAALREFGYE